MTTYFKFDQSIDNRIMRIIEDSIMLNPNVAEDDKEALINQLCYSMPYEDKDPNGQKFTYHAGYKSLTDKQISIQSAAPELLAALEAITERAEDVADKIHVEKRSEGVSQATHVNHMANHLAQHAKIARAAIAKAKGE